MSGRSAIKGGGSLPRSRPRRVARLLWAGPASLLGALLAPFFDSRRVVDDVLVCEGAAWPGRLRWPFRAMTLGQVVLCVDALDDATMRHELVHVRQFEKLGVFFMPAYLLASAWAVIRGRHFYRDNYFEADARRRAMSREVEAEETLGTPASMP
jgi:hypothetical protein